MQHITRPAVGSRTVFMIWWVIFLAFLAVPKELQAQGTAIQYNFTYRNEANYGSYGTSTVIETFQFTTSDFITTDGYVYAPSLDYCSVTGMMEGAGVFPPTPCDWVGILPSGPGSGGLYAEIDVADYYWFGGSYGGGYGANYFPLRSFSSVGEYDVVDSNYHYTAHLSVKEVAAPAIQVDPPTPIPLQFSFKTFTANLDMKTNGFHLNSQFSVQPGAVVDPVNSRMALRVGSFFCDIPAGSFTEGPSGHFVYIGIINGVALRATINPQGNGQYSFQVEAQGVDLSGSSTPVYLALLVGNIAGAAVITNE